MSALDQPILIANSGYHVGHLRSIQAAEDQGFFREERFTGYHNERSGLIPGPLEREGLALVMKERGVDIATAVNIRAFNFLNDPANFPYMWEMETRLRQESHNEDERVLRIVTRPERGAGVMPLDGQVSHPALASVIADMVEFGEIERPIEVDDVLRDERVADGLKQLKSRKLI